MRRSLLLIPLIVGGLAATADAHLKLTSHLSRYGDSAIKTGPCGVADGARTTDRVYIAKPGTEVLLVWDEYINHPGFYRIDFDEDGDDDLLDPHMACPAPQDDVDLCFDKTNSRPNMVNNITDEPEAVQNYLYTLPNVECDNCTLQVIQVMTDKPPYQSPGNDIYYQCVDIVLSADGPDELTLMGGNPGDPDAGGGGGGGGGENSGGCSVGSSPGSQTVLCLLALALWLRRRSRASTVA